MKHEMVKILPHGRNRLVFDANARYEIPSYISQSFDASLKKRTMRYRIISYMNVLDKITIKLKSKFRFNQ